MKMDAVRLIIALFLLLIISVIPLHILAQEAESANRHLYHPYHSADTIKTSMPEFSSLSVCDSLLRVKRTEDSLTRAIYVRDSLGRKQRMKDSVVLLRHEIQGLLEAYFTAVKEDIIIRFDPIPLQGDTALGNFTFMILPFGVRDPYTPWKGNITLTGRSIRFTLDAQKKKILGIRTPQAAATFTMSKNGKILIIEEAAVVQKNATGSFYKKPVDSVFYDAQNRITTVKKYLLFHALGAGNACGPLLFTNRTQFKQYEYNPDHTLKLYKITRYCERWKAYESNKLCSSLTYTISNGEGTCQVNRKNDPSNAYSDGTYTFYFNKPDNISSISFQNNAKTENWTRDIELNKDGFVNCYLDKTNNIIKQSLCMIYHKEPNAKYPVEEIITTFEKDGISYFQRNSTTGQIRTRNKMTLDWTPWRNE
jgi:hypothetical protein